MNDKTGVNVEIRRSDIHNKHKGGRTESGQEILLCTRAQVVRTKVKVKVKNTHGNKKTNKLKKKIKTRC